MKISDFPLFAEAPSEELAGLDERLSHSHRKAGDAIYRRGDESGGLYLLEEGVVRFDRTTRDGTGFTIGFCMPAGLFGELELIAGCVRDADAQAITDIRFRFLPAETFRELFTHSVWFVRNLCVIGNQVRRIQARMYRNAMTLDLSGRAAWWLVSLSQRRAGGNAPLRVSQEELAQLVGATRQTVNRQLRRWEEQGRVSLGYGAVTITDWRALMAEAGMMPP